MDANELLDLSLKAAQSQVQLSKEVMDNHLQAAERIHAREVNASIAEVAKQIALNPTSPP